VQIAIDDPGRPDVVVLLAEHLADMRAISPPESVHALDVAALKVPGMTFWTARDADALLGCGALKELDPAHAEIKSMRTAEPARGRGVGAAVLALLLETARSRGYARVSLETGTQDYFEPARRLYRRHGFSECEPFGDYRLDPFSAYFTLEV
jgi:putative acetyltransferase